MRAKAPRLPIATGQADALVPSEPRDSAERIEASFQAALLIIRHQRPFALDPWGQKRAGASEQRIAGMTGGTMRDRGIALRVRS